MKEEIQARYERVLRKKITKEIMDTLGDSREEDGVQWKKIRDSVIGAKKSDPSYKARLKELERTINDLLQLGCIRKKYVERNVFYELNETWFNVWSVTGDISRILSTHISKVMWNNASVTIYGILKGLDVKKQKDYEKELRAWSDKFEDLYHEFGAYHKELCKQLADEISKEITKYTSRCNEKKRKKILLCVGALHDIYDSEPSREKIAYGQMKLLEFMHGLTKSEKEMIGRYQDVLAECHRYPMIVANYESWIYAEAMKQRIV